MLSKFDLNLLKALDALLDERNVTRAAERLFITQQAASGALQRLRRHFGDELLVPVGRRLEHTPLAASLVIPVRAALLAAQSALETRPTFDPKLATGTCRIAMSDYSLMTVLPPFLRRLAAEAPGMRCRVEPLTGQSIDRLPMGDLNFCIAPALSRRWDAERRSETIRVEPLFDDDFVCVVDPRTVDVSQGLTIETYQALRHNTVAYGNGLATLVERAWDAAGANIDVAATAFNFSSLIFMLPGTALVATVQRRLARILAPHLGLAVFECPLPVQKLQENLIWHERHDSDPLHIYFRNTLKGAIADLDLKSEGAFAQ